MTRRPAVPAGSRGRRSRCSGPVCVCCVCVVCVCVRVCACVCGGRLARAVRRGCKVPAAVPVHTRTTAAPTSRSWPRQRVWAVAALLDGRRRAGGCTESIPMDARIGQPRRGTHQIEYEVCQRRRLHQGATVAFRTAGLGGHGELQAGGLCLVQRLPLEEHLRCAIGEGAAGRGRVFAGL